MPIINARPQVEQPLPRFISRRGFARHLVRLILRARAPIYPPQYMPLLLTPPHQALVRHVYAFEHPDHVSPLEMVMSKDEGILLKFFPEIIAEALIEEFGMPPYPQYIAQHLPPNFLISPTDSEPVLAVELMSLPAFEPEESTVDIEWDNPTEPIGFLHIARSASEQPEARIVSPTTVIVPTATVQQLVVTCPAPTSLTELRPAPTEGLTEQNNIVAVSSVLTESPPSIIHLRLRPNHLPE